MTTISPVRPIRTIIHNDDPIGYVNRLMVGTASRGLVRIEWHNAVRGIVVPPNWSMVTIVQPISSFIPVEYTVPDAQNMIIRETLARDFEWLILLEDDTIPPPDLFILFDEYMREGKVPIVSGLYYTKSEPSWPVIYRGRGTGSYLDFVPGEKVSCDGVPTGCLLIHQSILRAMWDDSEEYSVGSQMTRRVFHAPARTWVDEETGCISTTGGTSDLDWCTRVIDGSYFAKAGWSDLNGVEFPFVVDTRIRCNHIGQDGEVFPKKWPPLRDSQT